MPYSCLSCSPSRQQPRVGKYHMLVLFCGLNHVLDPEILGLREDRAHRVGKTDEKRTESTQDSSPKVLLCNRKNQVEAMKTSWAERTSPVRILSVRRTTQIYPAADTTSITSFWDSLGLAPILLRTVQLLCVVQHIKSTCLPYGLVCAAP